MLYRYSDKSVILTSVRWSEVQMIATPASKRDTRNADSGCNEKHGNRCVTVDIASCNQKYSGN